MLVLEWAKRGSHDYSFNIAYMPCHVGLHGAVVAKTLEREDGGPSRRQGWGMCGVA